MEVETHILNVSAMALVRLLGVASTESTRYYLNGVHARKRRGTPGVLLEATNGNILALECDQLGEVVGADEYVTGGPSYIVARWTIEAIKKAVKVQAKTWRIKPEELRVLISAAGFQFTHAKANGASAVYSVAPQPSCFIDGSFPEVERVMPQVDETHEGTKDAYNAENLAALAMASGSDCSFFRIYSAGIGNPALVRFSGAPMWLGVIMPCRVDRESTGPSPEWLATVRVRATVAA